MQSFFATEWSIVRMYHILNLAPLIIFHSFLLMLMFMVSQVRPVVWVLSSQASLPSLGQFRLPALEPPQG